MTEFSGSLPSIEIAIALWLAPLVPLAAALHALVVGRLNGAGDKPSRAPDPLLAALVAAVAALALAAMNGFALVTAPAEHRQLVSHAWTLLRIGSLDATFTLSMDAASALVAVATGIGACAVLGWATVAIVDPERRRRFALGASLALSGVLLVTLGDDWLLMTAGALSTGLASLSLTVSANRTAALGRFALGRLGDVALFCAGALMLWGLGGDWVGRDYLPDFQARLVAVQLGEAKPPPKTEPGERPKPVRDARGSLSMAALPGAKLVVGGAELCVTDADGHPGGVGTSARPCREVARPPFARVPLPVALQDVEVLTGAGTNDLIVEKLRVSPEQETLVSVAGSTLVLREMRDQLAIRDATGTHLLRAELGKKRFAGQPLLGLVGGLLVLFALLRGLLGARAPSASSDGDDEIGIATLLAGATDWLVAAVVILRTDFLLDLIPRTTLILAVLSAVALVWLAGRAAHAMNAKAALTSLAGADLALVVLALATGAREPAAALLAVRALGVVALGVSLAGATSAQGANQVADFASLGGLRSARPELSRASAVAASAVAGAPLPALGVFWGRDAALQSSAAVEVLGVAGWLAAVLGLLGSGILAFAIWRLHYLVFEGEKSRPVRDAKAAKPSSPRWLGSVAMALGVLALGVGALAVSNQAVESAPTPLLTWLRTFGAEATLDVMPDQSVRLAILALGFGAALAGWALARARYGTARAKDWVEREAERPLHAWLNAAGQKSLGELMAAPLLSLGERVSEIDSTLESLVAGAPASNEPGATRREGDD